MITHLYATVIDYQQLQERHIIFTEIAKMHLFTYKELVIYNDYLFDFVNYILLPCILQAYRLNPLMQDGLCTLAMCLYMEKHNRDLEKLLPTSYTDESSIDSHMWIVLAFVCYSNSNYSKALCLAQKVFIMIFI